MDPTHPDAASIAAAAALAAQLERQHQEAGATLARLRRRVDLATGFPDYFRGPVRVTVNGRTATLTNPETGATQAADLYTLPPAAALAALDMDTAPRTADKQRHRARIAAAASRPAEGRE
jgi:hypothetical protein